MAQDATLSLKTCYLERNYRDYDVNTILMREQKLTQLFTTDLDGYQLIVILFSQRNIALVSHKNCLKRG